MSSFIIPRPSSLSPEQHQNWERRQYVAECAIDFLASKDKPLDSDILAHLQDYVGGDATLGQAIGRIVDHFARQHQGFQPVPAH